MRTRAESHRVFVDTGAFAALTNLRDQNHLPALEIWKRLQRQRLAPFTTNFVVAETHALLIARAGHLAAREWLRTLAISEAWVTEDDYARGQAIVLGHRDKTYTLADATSFVVMERLGARVAFSFDRHFEQFGFDRVLP